MVMRAWPTEILALGDRIATLTASDAAQLSRYLETRYGFRPEALPIRIVPDPVDPVPLPVPDPLKAVLLEGYDQGRKLVLIKTLRELLPLGLIEARNLIEQMPVVLAKDLSPEMATTFKQKLELAGGRVKID